MIIEKPEINFWEWKLMELCERSMAAGTGK